LTCSRTRRNGLGDLIGRFQDLKREVIFEPQTNSTVIFEVQKHQKFKREVLTPRILGDMTCHYFLKTPIMYLIGGYRGVIGGLSEGYRRVIGGLSVR